MKNTRKENPKTVLPEDDNLNGYMYLYTIWVVFILVVNALFQKGSHVQFIKEAWGLNNFSYLPGLNQCIMLAIGLPLLLPRINNRFRLFLQNYIEFKNTQLKRGRKLLGFAIISAGVATVLYLLRIRYDLLGDLNVRVQQSIEGYYIKDEYLVMFIMHYLVIAVHTFSNISAHQVFVLTSVAGGFLYSFIGMLIADLLFSDKVYKYTFFSFYLFIGCLLFFCGYVEIYALPAVSAVLYIYTAVLFLKGKVNIVLPVLCLALAFALHKEQVSLLPSLVFLATRKIKFIENISARIIVLLFAVSIPLIYVINSFAHLQDLTLLRASTSQPYAPLLYSYSYVWFFFNSQYLSSNVLLLLLVVILIKLLRKQIQLDEYSRFFLIAALFILPIVFTMYKQRGAGDWDISAFPSIYMGMFVGYVLLGQLSKIYSKRKLFYVVSIALLLNSFGVMAWININHTDKSVVKVKDMLFVDSDPIHHFKSGYPQLSEIADMNRYHGSMDTALVYYKRSFEKYGKYFRFTAINYGGALMSVRDTDDAIPVYQFTINNYSDNLLSYEVLFIIYKQRDDKNKLYELEQRYMDMYDHNQMAILSNQSAKYTLINCLYDAYTNSLRFHDTLTSRKVLIRMKQLDLK